MDTKKQMLDKVIQNRIKKTEAVRKARKTDPYYEIRLSIEAGIFTEPTGDDGDFQLTHGFIENIAKAEATTEEKVADITVLMLLAKHKTLHRDQLVDQANFAISALNSIDFFEHFSQIQEKTEDIN